MCIRDSEWKNWRSERNREAVECRRCWRAECRAWQTVDAACRTLRGSWTALFPTEISAQCSYLDLPRHAPRYCITAMLRVKLLYAPHASAFNMTAQVGVRHIFGNISFTESRIMFINRHSELHYQRTCIMHVILFQSMPASEMSGFY